MALNASVLTPAGTVNRNSNGASASFDSATPLTAKSTDATGTRLVASIVIGTVAPAINTASASTDVIVAVGGGPGTTETVLEHAPMLPQPSNAVTFKVMLPRRPARGTAPGTVAR